MQRRFPHLSRREMLAGVSAGFGYMALAGLATERTGRPSGLRRTTG